MLRGSPAAVITATVRGVELRRRGLQSTATAGDARGKVLAFQPDLVIYSATTLDSRLMEINICELLRKRVDLKYDFIRETTARAGIVDKDLRTTPRGKKRLKSKLRPLYWGSMIRRSARSRRSADPRIYRLLWCSSPASARRTFRLPALSRLRGSKP